MEAREGKLDAAAVRSFPGFCLPYAKEQDTCGTHQVRQKNTAANSSSYRKGSIIGFVCSLKVFAISSAALITYMLANLHKKMPNPLRLMQMSKICRLKNHRRDVCSQKKQDKGGDKPQKKINRGRKATLGFKLAPRFQSSTSNRRRSPKLSGEISTAAWSYNQTSNSRSDSQMSLWTEGGASCCVA